MKTLISLLAFLLPMTSLCQIPTDRYVESRVSDSLLAKRREVDSVLHPAKYAKTVSDFLRHTFPPRDYAGGRWVFVEAVAEIKKHTVPEISRMMSQFDIYTVAMINRQSGNMGRCLILIDSSRLKTLLIEPVSYVPMDKDLFEKFRGYKFQNREALSIFMAEMTGLLNLTSVY